MVIEGNFIGTDPTGTVAHGNTDFGILANNGPSNVTIGGTTPGRAQPDLGQRNCNGINFGSARQLGGTGHLVQGNLIGTDALGRQRPRGTADRRSRRQRLQHERHDRRHDGREPQRHLGQRRLRRPAQQRVEPRRQRQLHRHRRHRDGPARQRQLRNPRRGQRQPRSAARRRERATSSPPTPSTASSISGGVTGVVVQGNFIGTDATGTFALGNQNRGIVVFGSNATIGGTAPGRGQRRRAQRRSAASSGPRQRLGQRRSAATRSTPTAPSASTSAATA